MPLLKLSKTEQRRFSVFIACLFLSGIAWFFFSLSNYYEFVITAKLNYKNFPSNKAFSPLHADTVQAMVLGTGWQLLLSKITGKKEVLEVDLRELEKKNFIVLPHQLENLNRQKKPLKIVSVNPDTLFFDFTEKTVKKVPVHLAYSLKLPKQYGLQGPIEIQPEYITVSGPAEVIKDVKSWTTDSLKISALNQNDYTFISLSGSKTNVSIYPKAVEVKVPVGEFTETDLEIPIQVYNNKNLEIKLLPEKVKVTYLVSLDKFKIIGKEDFKAGVDLNLWLLKGYTQLPVKLVKVPPYIKIVRFEPQVIDFIIKE